MSRLVWMMRNPAYLGSHEDEDEREIDSLDLAPVESSSAPIVTVPAEDEDGAEDGNTDHSTENEGRIHAPGPSVALAQLEDGVKQLAVDRSSKDEDTLQPLKADHTEKSLWSFDSWVNRMEPPWNLWSKELDIPDTT